MTAARMVLFDLGGVLFDFDHEDALRALAACGRPGADVDELRREIFERGLEDAYDRGRLSTAEVANELRRRVGWRGTVDELERAWGGIFRPRRRALALADELAARGFSLGLVSNTNAVHWRVLCGLVPGLAAFPHRFLSFELGTKKPEPAFYDVVRRGIAVPSGEALFVDDRTENVAGAVAAGFRGHLFSGEEALELELGLVAPVGRREGGRDGSRDDPFSLS
jgi:putative hydrolase of the HAD superfamily